MVHDQTGEKISPILLKKDYHFEPFF